MSTQAPKSSKPTKPPNQPSSTPPSSRSSSLTSHLAMVELKQRILTCLSKLSDRDTHQIALEDLEKIIQGLSSDGIPMILNALYDASGDPKPAVKKESIRLLAVVCASHGDLTVTHLTRIIAQIVRRLKDSDSGVRDACRDTIGALSAQYLKGQGGTDNGALGSMVALFVKPLFEAMADQSKGVQSGAAMCMAKMVECASQPPISAFQKLCPRICKLLNNPNFSAKSSLLPVVASLSQVKALAPQSLESLLNSVHECLRSTDWATRKAAADTLSTLALHSSNLITDNAASTLKVLEDRRFDKIKPVRESMTEALLLWKKIAGEEEGALDDQKAPTHDSSQPAESSDKSDPSMKKTDPSSKDPSDGSSTSSDLVSKAKDCSMPDKPVLVLKKKPPTLSDKELNPEFFHKLQTRGSDDMSVEVVLPRRCINTSKSANGEESESRGRPNRLGNSQSDDPHSSLSLKHRNIERVNGKDSRARMVDDDRVDMMNQRESSANQAGVSKVDGQLEGSSISNKGNWTAIQRQLMQMERQQANLMNMLQNFMGGSHDSMITLENRVRGLERVVEDMARDLSLSSGRRGGNFAMGFDGSSNRHSGKNNSFSDYSGSKFGRGGDGRAPFGERFGQSDGFHSGMRGRGSSWRSEGWDFPTYGGPRNGLLGSRKASMDGRSPKSEHDNDQVGSRRGWDKGAAGPVRFGEGPSARSVWQASKDEATLEAIRGAGEDNGKARTARVAIPELTMEAMGDENVGQERDPVWNSWSNAMDALHVGDMDSAYAEVLSTGDDVLLVKLMDRSGPVVDQLSNEVATDILHAIGQFLSVHNLFDICLSWIQQLVDIVIENGPDFLGTPMEVKKELLVNLHEAASTMDYPEDWEPDQLLLQLASAWEIDLQHPEE